MMRSEQKRLLEELRSALVGELHTQPFTIYNDNVIEELLKVQPKTLEELATVKGFPTNGKRIKCFGKAVIKIFNQEPKTEKAPVSEMKTIEAFTEKGGPSIVKKGKIFALIAVLTGSMLEPWSTAIAKDAFLQKEIALAAAKNKFVETSKEQAKEDWEEKQEKELKKKIKEEEAYEKSIKRAVEKWEKQVNRKKEKTLNSATMEIKKAAVTALKASAKAEEYAEKLKKKAEEKKKKKEQNYTSYSIGSDGDSSVKTWMDYRAITSVTSDQYKLQKNAITGEQGIRTLNGRYCIAVGSHYATKIGTKIDVVLESGTVLECILGDQKADKDTDSTNSYHECDGSYVEFVVDKESLDLQAKISGDMSSISGFEGKVAEIHVYEEE